MGGADTCSFPSDGPGSWAHAHTLVDLGEMTARWVLGEVGVVPGQDCEPDPETVEISDYLVAINLLGLVTDFSQPAAEADGERLTSQRAAVSGWCTPENARRLTRVTLEWDLIVLLNEPDTYCYTQIPITQDPGGPTEGRSDAYAIWDTAEDVAGAFTFLGSGMDPSASEAVFADICPPDALQAVRAAWYVAALDPVWGRRHELWTALIDALGRPRETVDLGGDRPG